MPPGIIKRLPFLCCLRAVVPLMKAPGRYRVNEYVCSFCAKVYVFEEEKTMDLTEAEQALLMLMLASYHRKHWTGNHFIFATGVIRACDHNLQNKTTCQKVLESLAKKCPYVYPSYPNSEHGKGWYYVDRETVIKEWWQMKTAKREPSHDNYVDLLEAAGMA